MRRCHGDLHLRNITLLNGVPTPFDAIEFDESIATIDILYDLAFLLMDLWEKGLPAQANTVLNRYLWGSPDRGRELEGLATLPLFMSLRAAVRAKVEALRLLEVAGGEDRGRRGAALLRLCAVLHGGRPAATGGHRRAVGRRQVDDRSPHRPADRPGARRRPPQERHRAEAPASASPSTAACPRRPMHGR